MLKFRLLNKLYAKMFGYFWTSCPLCKQMFGGHEWIMKAGIKSSIRVDKCTGEGICPECTKKGFGDC